MILREFDLDLSQIENYGKIELIARKNECNWDEATVSDYENNLKWIRFGFSLQVRCTCSFFERLYRYSENKGCWKLLVLCVATSDKDTISRGDVCKVKVKFDYSRFRSSSNYVKRKMTLETLMTGIRIASKEYNWDMAPFERVCQQIVEADYVNEWFWKKPKSSPDRKYKAQIFIQHEVEQVDTFIVISDKLGNEIKRRKIITGRPDEWFYVPKLGELKWLSNDVVALISKNGDEQWQVKVI